MPQGLVAKMTDEGLASRLAEMRRHYHTATAQAFRIQSALKKKIINATDDEKIVNVVMNGRGRILDIQIAETALRYPGRRLGVQLTLAITRARKKVAVLTDRAVERFLPEHPLPSEFRDRVAESLQPLAASFDSRKSEHSGPPEYRDEISEAFEGLAQVAGLHDDLRARKIKREIGRGAGVVEIDAANSSLKITISDDAPRLSGLQRLGNQVADALRAAEGTAATFRQDCLDQIRIGENSVGDRLRQIRQGKWDG